MPLSLSLYASGSNARGQLATGTTEDAHTFAPCIFLDTPPGRLPDGTTAVLHIACGANHTLALLSRAGAQEVWGCGDGRRGQLGPSHTGESLVFRPLDLRVEGLEGYEPRLVAAGWETSYVVLSSPGKSDVLVAMGANDFGNLGVGGATAVGQPVHRVPLLDVFPEPPEGDHVLTVQMLSAGPHHVVAALHLVMADGSTFDTLIGWGAARHGQLGDVKSGIQKSPSVQSVPRVIRLDDMPHVLGSVSGLALGNQHTVFLHSSGKVSGIGSNKKSQLQLVHTIEQARSVACTWNGTYALTRDGSEDRVIATGSNNHGQLGRGTDEPRGTLGRVNFPSSAGHRRILKLTCGSEHVLCLVEVELDGSTRREVWGWGWNEHGNLGIGTTEDVHTPVQMYPLTGDDDASRVLNVWGGNGTSWIAVQR